MHGRCVEKALPAYNSDTTALFLKPGEDRLECQQDQARLARMTRQGSVPLWKIRRNASRKLKSKERQTGVCVCAGFCVKHK